MLVVQEIYCEIAQQFSWALVWCDVHGWSNFHSVICISIVKKSKILCAQAVNIEI